MKELIEKLYWEELAKEGITKADVDMVMLDIAFSPVTPFKGAGPCEVTETVGGKYIVMAPTGAITVSPESLKVMRYRYLAFDPSRIRQSQAIHEHFGITKTLNKHETESLFSFL